MALPTASDNPFPSLLFEDHVDPAAPTNGYHRLFIDTDEKLKMIDHASLVTDFTPGAGGSVATDTIWDAAGDLAVGTGADTAARLAVGATAGMVLKSSGTAAAWGHPSGIVQIKTANSTADDSTTAATMQDSSLSLAFTPLYADSVLHVRVDGECQTEYTTGGAHATRIMWVGIYNSTNSVELVRQVRGMFLGATSTTGAVYAPIALLGTYTVNSTAARTFKFQFMSGVATNETAYITGSRAGGITMTITEVRP